MDDHVLEALLLPLVGDVPGQLVVPLRAGGVRLGREVAVPGPRPLGGQEGREGGLDLPLSHRRRRGVSGEAIARSGRGGPRENAEPGDHRRPSNRGGFRASRAVLPVGEDRRPIAHHGVAFHHVPVPVDADGRAGAFLQIERLLEAEAVDLVVLARYMQVLPPSLCERYAGRILNIHHSFLLVLRRRPTLSSGVRARGQAHRRHQPFRDPQTRRGSDHRAGRDPRRPRDTVEDMIRLGRDVEKTVLARSLRYVLEDRVLVNGKRTVVFR